MFFKFICTESIHTPFQSLTWWMEWTVAYNIQDLWFFIPSMLTHLFSSHLLSFALSHNDLPSIYQLPLQTFDTPPLFCPSMHTPTHHLPYLAAHPQTPTPVDTFHTFLPHNSTSLIIPHSNSMHRSLSFMRMNSLTEGAGVSSVAQENGVANTTFRSSITSDVMSENNFGALSNVRWVSESVSEWVSESVRMEGREYSTY